MFYKHGMTKSKIYHIWIQMHYRCRNKNATGYKHYGGRGIAVCNKWHEFKNFFNDMGHRPNGMSLDRINNNGNYKPSNCRWATKQQQQRNMRSNRWIKYGGEKLTLIGWAEKLNIGERTILTRLELNWPIKRILTAPAKPRRSICP